MDNNELWYDYSMTAFDKAGYAVVKAGGCMREKDILPFILECKYNEAFECGKIQFEIDFSTGDTLDNKK